MKEKEKLKRIPESERELMQVIWHNEQPITTGQITELVNVFKACSLPTVQNLLNRLEGRGFVSSKKDGRQRYYTAVVKEMDYLALEGSTLLSRLDKPSITGFVSALYDSKNITDDDLDMLQAFLDEKNKEG